MLTHKLGSFAFRKNSPSSERLSASSCYKRSLLGGKVLEFTGFSANVLAQLAQVDAPVD